MVQGARGRPGSPASSHLSDSVASTELGPEETLRENLLKERMTESWRNEAPWPSQAQPGSPVFSPLSCRIRHRVCTGTQVIYPASCLAKSRVPSSGSSEPLISPVGAEGRLSFSSCSPLRALPGGSSRPLLFPVLSTGSKHVLGPCPSPGHRCAHSVDALTHPLFYSRCLPFWEKMSYQSRMQVTHLDLHTVARVDRDVVETVQANVRG